MNVHALGIVIGVAGSAILTLGPWMFMVHAKLAVIVTKIAELDAKMEKAAAADRDLWSLCAQHETRLGTHDVQFTHIAERLQEI